MRVHMFVLCDSAVEVDGRLYVWSTFNEVKVDKSHFTLPRATVAILVWFDADEAGKHSGEIRLIDQDGHSILRTVGEFALDTSGCEHVMRCFPLEQTTKLRPGKYELHLFVDGKLEGEHPLTITIETNA